MRSRLFGKPGVTTVLILVLALWLVIEEKGENGPSLNFCPSEVTGIEEAQPFSPPLRPITPENITEIVELSQISHTELFAWAPDSRTLAVSDGQDIRLVDISDFDEVEIFQRPTSDFAELVYSPNGVKIAAANTDGLIEVYDPTSGMETMFIALLRHYDWYHPIAISTNGNLIAGTMSVDSNPPYQLDVRVWDLSTQEVRHTIPVSRLNPPVTSIDFSPNDRYLAFSTWGDADSSGPPHVIIWDLVLKQRIFDFKGPDTFVFGPDGTTMAIGSRLINCKGNTLKEFDSGIVSAFSPDGRLVVTTESNRANAITAWDAATGDPLLMLEGYPDFITNVSFSPDMQFLAFASDNTLHIWGVSPKSP